MAADTNPPFRRFPVIHIARIINPSRFYAIPILGILVKLVMLIPVYIFIFACGVAAVCVLFVNSFVVLFTGKYLPLAYRLNVGILHLSAKIEFFYSGLTDTYPGFSFDIQDKYTIDIPYPQNPNRWFAIPILGGLARIILLIPFYIYTSIVKNAVTVALVISWFPVLFQKYYPDTTFEIDRDSVRLNLAQWMYFTGLSDTYPSFWISMNHKNKKILLLLAGLLLFLSNSGRNTSHRYYQQTPKNNSSKSVTTPAPVQYNSNG